MNKNLQIKSLLLTPILAAICSVSQPVQASLIGHWTFNEGGGSIAGDSSGFGHNGSLNGDAVFGIQGDQGYVATGGAVGGVDWGDVVAFDTLPAFTLAIWLTPAALPSGETTLVGESWKSYAFSYYNNGRAYFYAGGGGFNTSTPLTVGEETFLVGTSDGTTLRLYQNGVEVGSAAASAFVSQAAFQAATVGDFTANFEGSINEVRFYDSILSGSDISALYAEGPVPVPEPSVMLLLLGVGGAWGVFARGKAVFARGSSC